MPRRFGFHSSETAEDVMMLRFLIFPLWFPSSAKPCRQPWSTSYIIQMYCVILNIDHMYFSSSCDLFALFFRDRTSMFLLFPMTKSLNRQKKENTADGTILTRDFFGGKLGIFSNCRNVEPDATIYG
uniref:Uncharacterized protein n=2 Tax=Triticum urartu TaxID=4572 RepID=A0A8R7TE54_TRIUA